MNKNKLTAFAKQNMSWCILLVVVIIFTLTTANFLTYTNIMNILMQNAYVVIAASGVCLILMSGQVDISIGYQMALAGVICAQLMVKFHWPMVLACLACILVTIICQVINCILALKLGITRMFVSIGTMTVYQGLSYILSNSVVINGFSNEFKFLGQGYIAGVSFPVIVMFILLIIMSFVLNKTYFGRYVYALGGNPEAARLAGINVRNVNLLISVICGIMVGLSTIVLISRLGSAHATTGPSTEFTVLTGMLLGGVSIRGGEGKLSGIFAGLLIIAILANGMQLAGLTIYYQYVAKGIIMLGAVGVDVYQMRRRNTARNLLKAKDNAKEHSAKA